MPRRNAGRQAALRAAYLGTEIQTQGAPEQRQQSLLHWARHPWNWLTGTDPETGRALILTKDEADHRLPLKPFPAEPHLKAIVDSIMGFPLLFIEKPRQIMATWATVLTVDWWLRFRPSQLWLLSKSTQDEAKQIMRDKVQHVQMHLPMWVQQELPVRMRPADRFTYEVTGSQLMAVAENAAEREFRGNTASGILIDECAYQDSFREMVAAASPMSGRIIAITTATLGSPGSQYCREILGYSRHHAA